MTNTKTEFYKKINELQTQIKVKKENKNNFGGYNYRSFEDICAIVKQNLNGLVLYVNDELIHEGDRFYIKATATITDGENSITNSSLAREEETKKGMDGAQVTGGASSYARKYALSGVLLLENEKDSDATNQHNNKYVNNTEKPQNNTQKKDYTIKVEPQPDEDYWGDAVIPEPNFDFEDNSNPKEDVTKDKKNVNDPATPKQLALLRAKGVISSSDVVTKAEASILIGNILEKNNSNK